MEATEGWNTDLARALKNVSYDSVTIHDYSYSQRWVVNRVNVHRAEASSYAMIL